jgi:hypothetical protein
MWEGIEMLLVLVGMVVVTLVANVLLEELTQLPDMVRSAIRGPGTHKSLASRLEELELRVAVAERKGARLPA